MEADEEELVESSCRAFFLEEEKSEDRVRLTVLAEVEVASSKEGTSKFMWGAMDWTAFSRGVF